MKSLFKKKEGLLSAWDVRVRLISGLIWLAGLIFMNHTVTVLSSGLILILLIIWDSKISMKKVIHCMRHVLPFVILMLVTLSLSEGFPVRRTAVQFSVLLCSRTMVGIIVIQAMIAGSNADDFIRSIAVLPIPPFFLSLLFLTNRYIDILSRDFRTEQMALRSRMFIPRFRFNVLKNIGYVVGGLFIRGYDRSEQVYAAMKSRCFSGVIPYGNLKKLRFRDYLRTAAASLILGVMITAERMF